jgi:hypothetical protein
MSGSERVLDAIGDAVDETVRRASWMRRWYVPVTAAGLTAIAIVALFRMEASAPNYDPQYMRVLVERTMAFGGSYYSNGVHNKGPLEPLLYEVAGRLGGPDGWWFVIALMTLAAAVVVGLAAAVVAVRAGSNTVLAVSVAVMAVVHLTLSDADYAGVLYARNLTTTFIAASLGVAAYGPFWANERTRRRAVLAVGVMSGLAVQTLLTASFTVTPVLVWAMWTRRHERVWGRPVWVMLPTTAAAAFATAPLYYLTLGPWQDFVDGFWTYARFMSTGTGLGWSEQVTLGWDQFRAYYGDRPELVVVLVAWLVITVARFRSMSPSVRGLHVAVACWWLAAWVELVLSQRYSSHYFSVLAVPTIMLIALAVGSLTPLVRPLMRARPAFALLPLLVASVTIDVGNRLWFDVGVDTAAAVRSTADFTERREVGVDGRTRVIRATLDLVSEDGDPLLMWTSYPWPYLNLERTSATRYIWKTFLMGEIYLGESGPEYVLPGTWERFVADLDDADPTAYYVESVNPIDPTTPFRTEVDARFTDVFADDAATLGLRNDLARWLTSPAVDGSPVAALPDAPYTVSPDGCVRLDGQLAAGTATPFAIETVGANGREAAIVVSVGRDDVLVESRPTGRTGWSHRVPVDGTEVEMSLVAGARAVVLVVDGQVAGAVEAQPGAPVVVTSGAAAVTAAGATLSTPPAFTGC